MEPAELERTIKLAEQRGRDAATIEGRLAEHDRHLAAINGSVDRLASSQQALEQHFLRATGAQEARDAAAKRDREEIKVAASKTFTRRQQYAGLAMILATVASAVFTAIGHA